MRVARAWPSQADNYTWGEEPAVRLNAEDGTIAVRYRRSLFLTTAIFTLACAAASLRPACAQSVTGNGVNPGGTVSLPHWSVGGDLEVTSPDPGVGTLTIQDGGTVTNDIGYIGTGASEHGEVTVSGHDGNGNASTWTSTGQVYIGESGIGALNINDGGVANASLAIIGNSGGSDGTVIVSGRDINGYPSLWNVTNQIYVGESGTGTLLIQDGGVVNSGQGVIGYSSSGAGTVTVSGRDINGHASTWNPANNIYVGFSGNGTLTIADGAEVATSTSGGGPASVFIGYEPGGTGTLTISSSNGYVSSLTPSDAVYVGYQGSGTMTVEKGGVVSVGSNVYIARLSTSSGALHLNGDATGRGVVETGSVVHGLGTTVILDLNGGILRATRDEANFLRGFATLTVGAEGAWFDTNAHDITIHTDFSGTSSFNKLGLGQLTLTGDSSGFTGASTVSAGTLAVNGVLGGNTLVDTPGRLVGTGQVGDTANRGIVAPGYGNTMGTLTVQGTYVSTGGRLEIATVLGDDSSQTSRLVVNGATSGLTQVEVINRGGLGGQTVEGIKIVDVTGTSNGSFVLDGDYVFQGAPAVIAGAYAYRLYQGGVSSPADGDWYLRSALLETGEPSPPLYQPGVPIYEAYGAHLQSLNTLPTLQQRVGNHSWEAGPHSRSGGVWGRTEGTYTRSNAAVSTSGANQSIDSWKMQLGADWLLADTNKDERLIAGINVNYGEASSRVRSILGNGTLKTEGYGIGATLTWYGVAGFYVDGQAQINHYSSDLGSDLLGTLTEDNSGRGEAFSIEAGKRMPIGGKLSITPQVQTVYSNVRFDRFVDVSDAVVSTGKGDSLRTRWGVTLDHQDAWEDGRSHIYGLVNLNYEWLDGTRALVSGTPIDRADERLSAEVGLGASIKWRKGLTLYSEVSGNSPFRDFGNSYSLKGSVGLYLHF